MGLPNVPLTEDLTFFENSLTCLTSIHEPLTHVEFHSPAWENDMTGTIPDEDGRVRALNDLKIIDSAPTSGLDHICRLARDLFDVPVALVTFVGEDHVWFKARCGLNAEGVLRESSFCDHTIRSDAVLAVSDLRSDPRFAANPLVVGEPHFVFYAGVPLSLTPGIRLGTLCILDTKPRTLGAHESKLLEHLAQLVAGELRLRQAAVELDHSEERYRALVEATSSIVWRTDVSGRPSEVNHTEPFAAPQTGSVMDAASADLIHPDDQPLSHAAWAEAVASGRPLDVIERKRTSDGSYRWVHVRGIPLKNSDGSIREWIGAATDIHERKQAEEALRESEERYRLLAEHATDMIIRVDLAGRLLYVSPAAGDTLGYSPDELTGARPQDFVHHEDADHLTAGLEELARGQADRTTKTYRMRRSDGSYIWIESKFQLIRDTEGSPLEIISAARDVTERHWRTEELRVAKEAAEQASQAKSDFLASMSHEIRTPLNGVLGYTDLLLNNPALDADQRRVAERIQTAGEALLTIVNDVLDFSRIEAGQVELEPQPFAPATLVDNAISIIKPLADHKQLDLVVHLDKTLPQRVVGDQDRLRQILLNLLNNAIKFTPQGEIRLAVRGSTRDSACSLHFSVSDTGIGIPVDKQDRLFQQFSQIDGSIRRQFGGTGLGLAISRRLVELMGGRMGVSSDLGQGSTFWFSLSLPVVHSEPPAPPAAVPAPLPCRPGRILLVEDNEINLEIARAILEGVGHEVDVAHDGSVAVMSVQRKTYDLVLMDIQMPVMDGMSAARHIRALEGAASRLPIIALTANVLPQQIRAFEEAGMNDHIGKPFKREAILAAVDRWLAAAPPCASAQAR
jgi:PAS domain S-box-containing protein